MTLPVRVTFRREGLRAVSLVVLHHGDELAFAGHEVRFYEVQQLRLGKPASARYQCFQCGVRLEAGELVVQCPLCTSLYHDECWSYLIGSRCYARGCRYSPTALEPEVAP